MKLSYVIVTHNRRDALLRTLAKLHEATPLPCDQWEVWVVDNGSTDGTPGMVRERFPGAGQGPGVHVIERPENEGVGARSHAFSPAAGEYLVLLDDDSYPAGDAIPRSIRYLDEHRRCGAVYGNVLLPDGSKEACALPSVLISCAVCIPKRVIAEVGGFRPEFFRKAGEYDFSFRILQAGYTIERFEDIIYRHDKVMIGRSSALAHRMDLRNNMILVERYLPRDMRRVYRGDWLRRYVAIARGAGHIDASRQAIAEARQWSRREAASGRQTLAPGILEQLFQWERQSRAVAAWARRHHVRRVVIADYGKNLFATWRACRIAGLHIAAIADGGGAFEGLSYRGVPILPLDETLRARDIEGMVISNINPAQVDGWVERVRRLFGGPVLRLWEPRHLDHKTAAPSAAAWQVRTGT